MSSNNVARKDGTGKPLYDHYGYMSVCRIKGVHDRDWHLAAIRDIILRSQWGKGRRENEVKLASEVTERLLELFPIAEWLIKDAEARNQSPGVISWQIWKDIDTEWENLCVEALEKAGTKRGSPERWNINYLNCLFNEEDLTSGFEPGGEYPHWPESSKMPCYESSGVLDIFLRLHWVLKELEHPGCSDEYRKELWEAQRSYEQDKTLRHRRPVAYQNLPPTQRSNTGYTKQKSRYRGAPNAAPPNDLDHLSRGSGKGSEARRLDDGDVQHGPRDRTTSRPESKPRRGAEQSSKRPQTRGQRRDLQTERPVFAEQYGVVKWPDQQPLMPSFQQRSSGSDYASRQQTGRGRPSESEQDKISVEMQKERLIDRLNRTRR